MRRTYDACVVLDTLFFSRFVFPSVHVQNVIFWLGCTRRATVVDLNLTFEAEDCACGCDN